MKILFFSTRWGSENIPLHDFLVKTLDNGFDGVEIGVPSAMPAGELELLFNICPRLGLKVIIQHYDTVDGDFARHRTAFADWFKKIEPYDPYLINCQTGRDFFSMEQNLELIAIAEQYAAARNIRVLHETHRGRFPFAAHETYKYLQAVRRINLALDISHWVNVAESFLEDQDISVSLALSRSEHIHARVGFPEGPQIPDPRDPRWRHAVEAHCSWWDEIIKRKCSLASGGDIGITPEFGPYPYLINMPFTDTPLVNQWDVNLYMSQLLKNRYASLVDKREKPVV